MNAATLASWVIINGSQPWLPIEPPPGFVATHPPGGPQRISVAKVSHVSALDQLDKVYEESSGANWDGYGAQAVARGSYEKAREILCSLPGSFESPDVGAEPTGKIAFDWVRGNDEFSFSIASDGALHYAGLFASGDEMHGLEHFDRHLPPVIFDGIRRASK